MNSLRAENDQSRKLKELFPMGANRLFFGDNLHIMRQLPRDSIDLMIYIDPRFFSGRNYNVMKCLINSINKKYVIN